ncbi:hypothetical protein KR222_007137 [Zaprionus bogoriensis]|nr:hypothetical protein KR222_007137 [Zaprionus bogoriensis]
MSTHCRTCGEPIYSSNPRNLFHHENEDIRHNIEAIAGITLSNESQLPRHICSCCYLDLNHSVAFRERCLETHRQLMDAGKRAVSIQTLQLDPLNERERDCEEKSEASAESITEELQEVKPKMERRQSQQHLPRVRVKHCHDSREDRQRTKNIRQAVALPTCSSGRFVAVRPAISIASKLVKSPAMPTSAKPKHQATTVAIAKENPKPRKPRITPLEKKYVCDQCGWSFRDLSNMKDHALRHSGVKKFDCDECPRKFFTRPLLMLHVRVHHKGEKPFVCKYCGMGFPNSPSRCRHERKYHAHELPYECNQCSRTFISKVSLEKHKIVHITGEEMSIFSSHSCNTCRKTFKGAASLKNHYLTKFHQRRVNQPESDDFDARDTVSEEDDLDFDFSDSMIEEIDE